MKQHPLCTDTEDARQRNGSADSGGAEAGVGSAGDPPPLSGPDG